MTLADKTFFGSLSIIETYEFYDRPLLYSCRDTDSQIYMCVWLGEDDASEEIENWLLSPISSAQFILFRMRALSFRDVFADTIHDRSIIVTINTITKEENHELIPTASLLEAQLPKVGNYVGNFVEAKEGIPQIVSLYEIKKVYTRALQNDSILIVYNVPAYYVLDNNGNQEEIYSSETQRLLEEKAYRTSKSISDSKEVIRLSWGDDVKDIPSDLEFKIKGHSLRTATIKIWRNALDKVGDSYNTISKAMANFLNVPNPRSPIIPYLLEGSIVIGLRSSEPESLFGEIQSDVSLKSMQLLIDATAWLEADDDVLDNEFRDNPIVMDAALRAIEALAPTKRDDIESIELRSQHRKLGDRQKVITITKETRVLAIQKRLDLAVESGDFRKVVLRGRIDVVKLGGEIHIADIRVEDLEDWTRTTITSKYLPVHLTDIFSLFGKEVKITAMQKRTPTGWAAKLDLVGIATID